MAAALVPQMEEKISATRRISEPISEIISRYFTLMPDLSVVTMVIPP
jgi:hypothetical protein